MNSDSPTIEIADTEKLPADPLVSVYMLAYKHEKFIAEAIEGVIAQKCDFPIELIIGEDCSPDHTGEIVRDYQKQYPQLIRVLTADRNVGAHANASRCRDACRGQFIAICEGDDYWHHPGKLRMQVEVMSRSPSTTLCHTEFDRRIGFRIKRNRHGTIRGDTIAVGDAYAALLQEWTVMTGTTLYRTDIVEEFRRSKFYNRAWPFGDYNLALYASLKGQIAYLPTSTATWRRVGGSASNNGPAKALAMHTAATECRHMFMQAHPVTTEQALSIERNIHVKFLHLAFWANRPDAYASSLSWLIRHGYVENSGKHAIKQLAMRTRAPIYVLDRVRRLMRSLAECDLPTVRNNMHRR